MTGRIDEIRMEGALPKVFVSEDIPSSQIWKNEVVFRRGHQYQIEAASGGGKSSMCAFIIGARSDYNGKIFFNGRDIAEIKIPEWQEIRRRHIAYLPQELMLFPELTALQNIELKNNLTGAVRRPQIEEWLHELGIDSRRDYPAGRMSVGQQQRVAIIRAICQPFDFILLDEPVSHLDEENNHKAARIITEAASKQEAAIISTSVGNPLYLPESTRLHL